MSFLHPVVLWGLLGAAIPLLIHLWGRRRPRRVPFPSLRLLRTGERRQRSFSRIRELLLLLLRMLLICTLALALAGPVLESSAVPLSPEQAARVSIILDVSASMNCRVAERTSLDRGIRAAQVILESLPDSAAAELFALGRGLEELDRAQLEGVRAEPVRAAVLATLAESDSERIWGQDARLFVITDLRETSLAGELSEPLPQPPVFVDVGHPQAANRHFSRVRNATPCPLRGRPLELVARVSQTGAGKPSEPARVTAALSGAHVPGQTASFQSNAAEVRLRAIPQSGGPAVWALTLPGDALPGDNTCRLTQPMRETLRVAIITGESDPALISAALNPGGEADTHIQIRAARWTRLDRGLPPADLYLAADVPDDARARLLEGALGEGRGVLLFSGRGGRISPGLMKRLLGAEIALGPPVSAPPGEPWTLADLDTLRGPLAPFANPRAGNLLEFTFGTRREISLDDNAPTLAWFSDGSPALVACADPERACILLNTSLDDAWTDAPFQPAFVPFIHHLCYDLAGPARRVWVDGLAGEILRIALPAGARGNARVSIPGGETRVVSPDRGAWEFTPPVPGIYRATWEQGEGRQTATFAANLNPLESDFSRVSQADLRRRVKGPDALVISPEQLDEFLARRATHRANLTFPLLVLALLLLAADTFISARPTSALEEDGGAS